MALFVVSWNLGVSRSCWQANNSGWANRTRGVRQLLREVAPDVLLLQELGIHEEGIPPEELEKALLHESNDYSLIANASYAILLKSSRLRLAGPSKLVSLSSGSQSWRMAQIVDVHVDLGEEFRLINVHLVSGQGIVAVKADYGRGAAVA